MDDLVGPLRRLARTRHRLTKRGDAGCLSWARQHEELRGLDDRALRVSVLRRHCLALIARQLGFRGWPDARRLLDGEHHCEDFGTIAYEPRCAVYCNLWSASYLEARRLREATRGTLLGYQRHFLVVEPGFLETLGLDPRDPDWDRIGHDWVRPADGAAWRRLTLPLVSNRMRTQWRNLQLRRPATTGRQRV